MLNINRAARKLWRASPLAFLGLVILLGWIVAILFTSRVAIDDGLTQSIAQRFVPPGSGHPFGTDNLGRDVFSRVIHGARISLPVGVLVVTLSGTLGTLVGIVAGYFGRWVDEALMRFCDLMLAFPAIILAMAIAAALGPSLRNSLIAIVIVSWPSYARVVRSLVITVKEREFVEAAHALGATHSRILFRTILPNTISSLLVMATLDVGNAILTFAGLGFLGLGQAPPTPEWGAMVAAGTQNFTKWWIGTFPGLAIFSCSMAFNFLGDALRDLMDPRLRRLI